MNILITGGAGFIPSSTADKLLLDPTNFVVLIDNFLTGSRQNIPVHENCKFFEIDVNNFEQIKGIFDAFSFDYVFHYAAVVGVKRTLENPIMVLDDIQGIKNILDLCKNSNVKRVFYSSSSEVYGEPVHLPQNEETTPLNSRLPYAVVKNVGESYFKSYYQEFGLKYTIFRFFNTYGPRQSTDFVISKFLSLASENKDITIYGDGSQSRTFCYIDDNLDTIEKILVETHCLNDVINIGSDIEFTILELAKVIIKQLKSESKIVFLPPLKDGDMTRRKPDLSKMKSILGRELVSLEEGITKTLENKFF